MAFSLTEDISGYCGRIKILRLLLRAESNDDQRDEALALALRIIAEETFDWRAYVSIGNMLSTGRRMVDYDTKIEERLRALQESTTDKLETEVRAYKNNLIKESIRMGQQDLARHLWRCGDLETALKVLARNRDYCTTALQVFHTYLDMTKIALLQASWAQALSSTTKLESIVESATQAGLEHDDVMREVIRCAAAIGQLGQRQYQAAARSFSNLTIKLSGHLNELVTMRDIADLTAVLTLATSDRAAMSRLVRLPTYKPYLELSIDGREAMLAFQRGEYAACLARLEIVLERLRLIPFAVLHVTTLQSMIRRNAIIQYCKAFTQVSLDRFAATMSITRMTLERELAGLIFSEDLPAWSIDCMAGVLILLPELEQKPPVDFIVTVEAALFRMAVKRADLRLERLSSSARENSGPSREQLNVLNVATTPEFEPISAE
ncbi:hypothetical protein PYCC9005_005258 [Savitreella phatthalungensis]